MCPVFDILITEVTEKEKALLDYHVLNRGVQKVALSSSLPLVQKVRIIRNHRLAK